MLYLTNFVSGHYGLDLHGLQILKLLTCLYVDAQGVGNILRCILVDNLCLLRPGSATLGRLDALLDEHGLTWTPQALVF